MIFDIEPVEQARPRAVRRGKRIGMYDPPKVSKFKRELRMLAKNRFGDDPLDGELSVEIKFYRSIQKSLSKKERDRRLSGEHRPIVKPDLDNYVKSALDALNGVLWTDDARIVELHAFKHYSDSPRIEVVVKELE